MNQIKNLRLSNTDIEWDYHLLRKYNATKTSNHGLFTLHQIEVNAKSKRHGKN